MRALAKNERKEPRPLPYAAQSSHNRLEALWTHIQLLFLKTLQGFSSSLLEVRAHTCYGPQVPVSWPVSSRSSPPPWALCPHCKRTKLLFCPGISALIGLCPGHVFLRAVQGHCLFASVLLIAPGEAFARKAESHPSLCLLGDSCSPRWSFPPSEREGLCLIPCCDPSTALRIATAPEHWGGL